MNGLVWVELVLACWALTDLLVDFEWLGGGNFGVSFFCG